MLKTLLYTTFFALIMGQFMLVSRGGIDGGGNVYIFDVLLLVFALFGVAYFTLVRNSFVIPRGYVFFLFFTISAFISLIPRFFDLPFGSFLVAGFYLLRWFSYLSGGLVIYNMLRANLVTKNELLEMVGWFLFLFCVMGVVQLVLLPDFETLDPSLGWDPHKNRLASTFFDPNFAAAFICLSVALVSQLQMSWTRRFIFIVFPLICLFFTFSRSGWLMMSTIILIYGFFKSKKLLLIALLVAFSAYFFVPRIQTRIAGITDPADSAQFRLISWNNTWDIAKEHLALGVGFNAFRYAREEYGFISTGTSGGNSGAGSDSSFLLILATTGVCGLLVFCLAYFYPFYVSKNVLWWGIWLGLLIDTQFINAFFYPQILFSFFVALNTFVYVDGRPRLRVFDK